MPPPRPRPLLTRSISLGLFRRFRKPGPLQPSLDFSLTGMIFSSMMFFLVLAAMNTQANLLFGVFGLMVGILVVSGFVSRAMVKKLSLRRILPEHGVVGQKMVADYEITNAKRRWPSLSVAVAELDGLESVAEQPRCYMLHAAPTTTVRIPVEMIPRKRGLCEFDHFQLSTSFPFGFIKRAVVDRHKDSICIFPALAEVDHQVLAMCRSADNIGQAVRPRGGGMDEFYGVREYRPGDNPRQIYWRRSARTGVLVAREMMRVSPPRLHLLVDTHLPNPTPASRAMIERVIAMAASLASMALQREMAVGLSAWNGKPVSLIPSRGKQHREDLLTFLARLPGNTDFDPGRLLHDGESLLRQGATLVILTAGEFRFPLPEHSRGSVVVLSAASERIRGLFTFSPEVQFEKMLDPMPQ